MEDIVRWVIILLFLLILFVMRYGLYVDPGTLTFCIIAISVLAVIGGIIHCYPPPWTVTLPFEIKFNTTS